MMKTAICFIAFGLLGLAAGEFSVNLEDEWSKFKVTYERGYGDTEEPLRKTIFMNNLKTILRHNVEADMGVHSYWMGVNQFADMSFEEFRDMMTGCLLKAINVTGGSTFLPPENVVSPSQVDWRKKGYVTPVKNQGTCGSCYTFSSTGALEGQHKRKTGKLVSLSEQQILDCSVPWGNGGCRGGLMPNAFRYVRDVKGIDTESCYPYEGKKGPCRAKKSCFAATCTGYQIVKPQFSEKALKTAVATVGPISIGIDATHKSFQLYSHGVYDEPACNQTRIDHGVLAVGYGRENGKDYWLVKNSWGPKWGIQGYVKMVRNKKNQCGVASIASYPLV